METHPETQTNNLPVNQTPVVIRIPEWEQFPAQKRAELVQILAGILVRQVERQAASHEHPS
jgi:hypothetical protein